MKQLSLTKQYIPYDRYIDSGVDWLGQVPEGWNVLKLKQFAEVVTGSTPPKSDEENYSKDGILWIKPDNLNEFEPIENTKDKVSKKGALSSRIIPEKSILVNGIGDIGRIGINKVPAFTNQQINSIILNKNKVKFGFGKYAVYSSKEELQANSNKVVVPILNKSQQKNISYPIPPLPTQQRIATYLDEKTEKIDKIIAGKKRLVELLEEKRKSVISEAIDGSNGKLIKLKNLVIGKLQYGANEPAVSDDPNYPRYIRITDFGSDRNLRKNTFRSLPLEKAYGYMLNEGDVLFARSGATVGKTFQFKNYSGRACFAGYLIKATPNPKKLLSDYLYYFTKSASYENWKKSIFIQATIQNIGADKYQELEILTPSISEQEKIVSILDEQTSKIDDIIKAVKQSIQLLTEYKSSLISHVVTGRVKV